MWNDEIIITGLRCNDLVRPMNVEGSPSFSWKIRCDECGAEQIAWRIICGLKNSGRPDMWDSGFVFDNRYEAHYAGLALNSGESYWWRVMAQMKTNKGTCTVESPVAYFDSGLLQKEDWAPAQWICDPSPLPAPSAPHKGYCSMDTENPFEHKWIKIDLGGLCHTDGICLMGTRRFDAYGTNDAPGWLFPLRFIIEGSENDTFDNPILLVDKRERDFANPGSQPLVFSYTGIQLRYIRLTTYRLAASDERHYAMSFAEIMVLDGQKIVSNGCSVEVSDSLENNEHSSVMLTDGDVYWHNGGDIQPLPLPQFRKEFLITKEVQSARLFIAALGIYEIELNGRIVSDARLAPEWTDYSWQTFYDAYDVTKEIEAGMNAVGITLADGWYAGRLGMSQCERIHNKLRGVYGRKPMWIGGIKLNYADGTDEWIYSSELWKVTVDGPWRRADLLDGICYNSEMEMHGWSQSGYDDATWHCAMKTDPKINLTAYPGEHTKVCGTRTAQRVYSGERGSWILDLGGNISGTIRMKVNLQKDGDIVIRYAQWARDDGSLYFTSLRGAYQTDIYHLKKGETIIEPKFTHHGFRYVQVFGLEYMPDASDLQGLALNLAFEEAGTFACSEPLLNDLWSAFRRTIISNYTGIATDVIGRDERLPWGWYNIGEPYLFNMRAYLRRHLREIVHSQGADGAIPSSAPMCVRMRDAPSMGSINLIHTAWLAYQTYADLDMIRIVYDAAKKHANYMEQTNPNRICEFAWGDWLDTDSVLAMPTRPDYNIYALKEILGTCFCGQYMSIVSEMAGVLGDLESQRRFQQFANEFKNAFAKEFLLEDGSLQNDYAGAYAVALSANMIPEEKIQQCVEHMVKAVRRADYHFTGGNYSGFALLDQLCRHDYKDEAFRLMTGVDFPSYGYMLKVGSDTIWERWDSYVRERTDDTPRKKWNSTNGDWDTYVPEAQFADFTMNDFNHRMFCQVVFWYYEWILGIRATSPGYRTVCIEPDMRKELPFAQGSFESVSGRYEIAWEHNGNSLLLSITVPVGCSAEVILPVFTQIKLNGKPIQMVERNGKNTFVILSGKYEFAVVE